MAIDQKPGTHAPFVVGQWPDDIAKGFIKYSPSHSTNGFTLHDASHGIPVIGFLHEGEKAQLLVGSTVEVCNYPQQTEAIARRLVACWNASVGMSLDHLERVAAQNAQSQLARTKS